MNSVPPPEWLVMGAHGPGTFVSGRVCAYLARYAGLDAFRVTNRGADLEVDNTLVAMRLAELAWQQSATGTRETSKPEPARKWKSTGEVAGLLGVTDRSIRRAIQENRLKAINVAGRWRIGPEDLEHFKAARAA